MYVCMYYIYVRLYFMFPMLNAITKYFVFAKFHFMFKPQACLLLLQCVCVCDCVCVCVCLPKTFSMLC